MFEKIPWAEYAPRVTMSSVKLLYRKICQLLARFMLFNGVRIVLYRMMGMRIGSDVYIGYDCYFDSDFAELVTIEEGAMVSFRVIIVAHDWSRRIVSRILIKKGAYIGTGAIILPGVIIGEKSVVAAGAVVMRDVPDGATVLGNPAQPIMK